MLTTKDPQAFLKPFAGLAQEVIAAPVAGQHAGRDVGEIARLACSAGIEAASCPGVEAALRFLAARSWPVPPRILVTGSLYLAGEVLALNGSLPE